MFILTFQKHCWRSRQPAHPSPVQHVDGPSLKLRGPAQTHTRDHLAFQTLHTNNSDYHHKRQKSELHLLKLQDFSFQTLEFLLVLLGLREDLIPGGSGLLQLPLVVFHLSLQEQQRDTDKLRD